MGRALLGAALASATAAARATAELRGCRNGVDTARVSMRRSCRRLSLDTYPIFSSARQAAAERRGQPLGGRTLRVIGVEDNDADQPPVLVVESATQVFRSGAIEGVDAYLLEPRADGIPTLINPVWNAVGLASVARTITGTSRFQRLGAAALRHSVAEQAVADAPDVEDAVLGAGHRQLPPQPGSV